MDLATQILRALNDILAGVDEDELHDALDTGSTMAAAIDQLDDLVTDMLREHYGPDAAERALDHLGLELAAALN